MPVPRLAGGSPGEGSGEVRQRVLSAREIQRARLREEAGIHANGQMGPDQIRRFCRPSTEVARLLQRALDRLRLSARAYHRILKVARTLADLEGTPEILVRHAAEAIQYRALDRGWP